MRIFVSILTCGVIMIFVATGVSVLLLGGWPINAGSCDVDRLAIGMTRDQVRRDLRPADVVVPVTGIALPGRRRPPDDATGYRGFGLGTRQRRTEGREGRPDAQGVGTMKREWPLVRRSAYDRIWRENVELRSALRNANAELLKHRQLLAGIRDHSIDVVGIVDRADEVRKSVDERRESIRAGARRAPKRFEL